MEGTREGKPERVNNYSHKRLLAREKKSEALFTRRRCTQRWWRYDARTAVQRLIEHDREREKKEDGEGFR